MTKAQLITELRKAGKVFAFCVWSQDDGIYLQASKAHILGILEYAPDDMKFIAYRDDDGLWIG